MDSLKTFVCERFAEMLKNERNLKWKRQLLKDLEDLRKDFGPETIYTTGLPNFSPKRDNVKRLIETRKQIEFSKFLEKRREELERMNINARRAVDEKTGRLVESNIRFEIQRAFPHDAVVSYFISVTVPSHLAHEKCD